MKVYLAGPMRGIPDCNFPAFKRAALMLRSAGYEVLSPAEQDIAMGFDPMGNPDITKEQFVLFMHRDLDMLAECDGIILLKGWQNSKGATLERAIAAFLNLAIMEYWEPEGN